MPDVSPTPEITLIHLMREIEDLRERVQRLERGPASGYQAPVQPLYPPPGSPPWDWARPWWQNPVTCGGTGTAANPQTTTFGASPASCPNNVAGAGAVNLNPGT